MPDSYAQPAFAEPEDGTTQDDSQQAAWYEQLNVAEDLSDARLAEIGERVKRETEIDDESRKEWLDRVESALDLARQVEKEKNEPWKRAANVKWPLMTSAAIQFGARAYPAIVQGSDIVKGKVIGLSTDEKTARAERIATHMSYQLATEMPEWDGETDKLLHMLPVVGCLFRKVMWDVEHSRPVTELCLPEDVIVNYRARDLETVPRVTHRIKFYPYEIEERRRDGRFLDIKLDETSEEQPEDESGPVRFLEQHCRIDLDDDGYDEPLVVTIHEESARVVRITARFDPEDVLFDGDRIVRIEPRQMFTKFDFMPALDGGFYGEGFGTLLGPINKAVNTTINQLLDAGTLSNAGGGMIAKGGAIKKASISTMPGRWEYVDATGAKLGDSVYPWPHREPSPVLLNLMLAMVEAGKEISGLKDVLTGDIPAGGANMPATTVMALIEQGQKVFNAIYKRVFRSLKLEFAKIRRLNRIYLDQDRYLAVIDWKPPGGPPMGGMPGEMPGMQGAPQMMQAPSSFGPPGMPPSMMQPGMGQMPPMPQPPTPQDDYADEDCDVEPVSDPSAVSDQQKLGKAQLLAQLTGLFPELDRREVVKRVLEAGHFTDVDSLLPPPQPMPPPPEMIKLQLEAQMAQARAQEAQARLQLEGMKLQQAGAIAGQKAQMDQRKQELAEAEFLRESVKTGADLAGARADYALKTAQTVRELEEAEAVQPGMQVEQRKVEVAAMQKRGGENGGSGGS